MTTKTRPQLTLFANYPEPAAPRPSGMAVRAFSAASFARKRKGIARCYGCGGTNKVRDLPPESGMAGEYCRECVP